MFLIVNTLIEDKIIFLDQNLIQKDEILKMTRRMDEKEQK